jgi:hypothetical protein
MGIVMAKDAQVLRPGALKDRTKKEIASMT